MRTGTMIATYVGVNQQGGQTDLRYMVIMKSDARGIRKQQGLPTVESNADARFGFDGGRHAQVLLQLRKAGVNSCDWLLVNSLLKRYTMRVQVRTRQGVIAYLEDIKPEGGGMVQGLSTSSPLYTLLPRHLQERVAHVVPSAGVLIPQLLLGYTNRPQTGTVKYFATSRMTGYALGPGAWKQ